MRLRLIPQERAFYDLFDQAASNTVEAAKLYKELVDRFEDPKATHKAIRELEHKGDAITHETIHRLNTTFVTPLDREDIHALATSLDDITDFIEAAADNYNLHSIERPTEAARQQAEVLVRVCEAVEAGIKHLREFKGLEQYWILVNEIENEGDRIYRKAIADLFGGDHKAMEVLKWKEIYDEVESAVDRCEDIANQLEAMVLKHA